MPYIIYADMDSLILKNVCANIPKNLSTTKISEHIPCGYSMSKIRAFNQIENKHTLYCRKDCLKKLKFNVPNESPVVFHNGSRYNYYSIIKELASRFEGKSEYLRENTENFKTFSVPIEKEVTKIDKDGNKVF